MQKMKALVFHGPGKRAWEDVPRPTIKDPGDTFGNAATAGALKVVLKSA